MNPKKISVRLRILSSDISEYFRGSCFGVPAMDPEVLRLWREYNDILEELKDSFPDIFGDLEEVPYPAPYLADEESFYREGTMLYKPEHFAIIRTAVNHMLKLTIPLTWGKETA